ncbi:MAG: hypothetical protein IJT83_13735, partial [Victivallales bacterium]|nr:hypothetical protein [Victivallales bacterium]
MRQVAAILLLLLFTPMLSNAKRLHVSMSGDDSQDGLSWSTARRSVQSAINSSEAGDEVWVASGSYTATSIRACDSAYLYASSFILKDGVSLFGGFKGDETTIEARPRDGDALWQFSHATILTVPSDAPGSVLFSDAAVFEHSTLIDGFTLCGGMALGVGVEGIGGGAVLPGKAIMQNCIVEANLARDGGGVATNGDAFIRQCLIRDNEVADEGWGGCGGGVYCEGDGTRIENCLVVANGQERTVRYGGGIHSVGNACIAFCTVVDNWALRSGSAIVLEGNGKLLSSIVWRNSGSALQLSAPCAQIASCAVEGELHPGSNILLERTNCGKNGILSNDNWVDGYYVCFANPDNGDFHLAPGSYAINRGVVPADDLPAVDAQGNARVAQNLPDIGAFESPHKGNLAIDFEVAFPCFYKNSSKVVPKLGLCSPASIALSFTEQTNSSEWNGNGGRWTATWNKAGNVKPQLDAAVTGEQAAAWNEAQLVRTLTVSRRPIAVKARDISYTYGEEFPVLEYDVTAGSLAEGDSFTGSLACELGDVLDATYPITQGSLTVQDGNGGNNYTIHYQEGMLTYHKATAEMSIVSNEVEYTGTPCEPQIATEPENLPMTILYEGTDGTDYPPSETPPTDAGTYHIIVVIEDDHYAGTLETDFTILPKPLAITADSKSRMYMEPNPDFTLTFEGFVPGDGIADIQLPTISTTAQTDSLPGTYPITLTGGSARNYTFLPQEGTLTITKATLNATVSADAITYGDTLDNTLLHGNATLSFADHNVPGAFSWVEPNQLLPKGHYTLEWLFTPEQTDRFLPVSGSVELTVNPMEVAVAADAKSIVYGQQDVPLTYTVTAGHLIGDDTFTGSLSRLAGNQAGTYLIQQGTLQLNDNYTISYTPATYTIQKATPENTDGDIAATGITYGQPLSDSEITGTIYNAHNGEEVPGVFVWEEPDTVRPAGTHVMECRFIPDDTENYNEFTTTCEVTVAKAPFAITSPGATKTYGEDDPVIPFIVQDGMPQNVQVLGAPGRAAGEAAGSYELTA